MMPTDGAAGLPILYSFRRCPYAMRARFALIASETLCEIREVKLSAKPAELIAASPKATVPVMQLADGQVIDQSIDIMRWSLRRHDPLRWLQGDDADLIAANDGAFKHALDRYKYPDRHGVDAMEHRERGLEFLTTLEARLNVQATLSGPVHGLADMAIMPFVRQFAEVDRPWFDAQPLPALQRWLDALLQDPLFGRAMVRLSPWQAGDVPITFPMSTQPDPI